jgi:hypothetical protein
MMGNSLSGGARLTLFVVITSRRKFVASINRQKNARRALTAHANADPPAPDQNRKSNQKGKQPQAHWHAASMSLMFGNGTITVDIL